MPLASLARLFARKTTLCIGRAVEAAHVAGGSLHLKGQGLEKSLPLSSLRRVILLGRVNLPMDLLYDLAAANVPVEWQDQAGRALALLWPQGEGYDSLALVQSAFCRSPAAFELARAIILAKVDNCAEILRRRVAEHPNWPEFRRAIAAADSPESLRGHEGAAARAYFECWKGLLHRFEWRGRKPRPAPDPVNMILSRGYSLLRNRLASALRHAGLDPRLGFFHTGRGRHCALASDLMEPLRACVDMETLTLLRREKLKPEDFRMSGDRCVSANDMCFLTLLHTFEDMFEKKRRYFIDPENREAVLERSLNDLLDDLAESFALHVHDGRHCIIPRLAPCGAA